MVIDLYGCFSLCVWFQVSHHPPVSALYVTNRQEGFSVSATVLAKSKFYGECGVVGGKTRLCI